jgi:hypothetical protein
LSCVGRFFTGVSQLNGDGIVAFIPACSYQKRRSEVAVTARNAGSIGSIRFLHPSVVAEKLLKNVQGLHNRRAVLCEYGQGKRLATPLSAHGSAPWGSIFVGSSSRPQTGGQTLTNEASIEGRFRFAGKKPGL